ncbi:MAG TPA: hypothetical protein VN043_15395 [Rhodanobacter sp.]|nr:hypothetical protein [Rhodanobacter sp.]
MMQVQLNVASETEVGTQDPATAAGEDVAVALTRQLTIARLGHTMQLFVDVAVGEAMQRIECRQGGLPALLDLAAIDIAQCTRPTHPIPVAGEDRAKRCARLFAKRCVDRVEQRAGALEVEARRAGEQHRSDAVPMHADAMFSGQRGDAFELVERHAGTLMPPHRALDRG